MNLIDPPISFGTAPPQGGAWHVHRLRPGEPLQAVRELRQEVYCREQGLSLEGDARLVDGLDASATSVCVRHGPRLVGTMRLHDLGTAGVRGLYGELFAAERFVQVYPATRVVVGSRLAVLFEQRRQEVLDRLMAEAYRHVLEHGMRFGLLACPPSLAALFEHYGFREYLPPKVLPSGEAVLRMVLVCEDAVHLAACASPLLPLVRQPALGEASRAWLRRCFPAAQ